MKTQRTLTRQQKTIIVGGILSIVMIIVILQLWLLTATMNAFLAGERAVIVPAGAVSVICLLLNLGLLFYIDRMERRG